MPDTRSSDSLPPLGPSPKGRGLAFQVAVLGLVAVSALAGTGLARLLRGPGLDDPNPPKSAPSKYIASLFRGWEKPDLVVVVSGQQNGYLLPCGCSSPQIGGLERRYNVIQMLKERGWPVTAVDVGDLAQKQGPVFLPNVQALIKYRYSMMALDKMGYTGVGIGRSEAALKLGDVLAEYPLNFPNPTVLAANLLEADRHFPEQTKPWKLVDPTTTGGVRVGVTGVIGPTVAAQIKDITNSDPTIRFGATPTALNGVLKEMEDAKVQLRILLYQGPLTRGTAKDPPTEALGCARAYPQFPLVVCLSAEDDPPSRPTEVTTTSGSTSWVLTLGRKGKYVGVVGVWKTGKVDRPFEFRYQLVEMTEDFITPPEKEAGNPIVQLMEDYTQELKTSDYLNRYGQVKHLVQALPPVPDLRNPATANDPTFVGSEKCKRCHEDAYEVWRKSGHSHAYQTLVDARKPSNRQYDPECIVCHTVGFGYQGGFVDAKKTPHLKDVGCESCHGPASVHVLNPENEEWQRRLNPWKLPENATAEQKRKQREQMDQFCQKCHDVDNDVTWIHGGFEKKWPKIAHPTPKASE